MPSNNQINSLQQYDNFNKNDYKSDIENRIEYNINDNNLNRTNLREFNNTDNSIQQILNQTNTYNRTSFVEREQQRASDRETGLGGLPPQ